MPAKRSFQKCLVVDAAFKITREKGWDKLTARSLAKELNCSTMPIYSYLKSMKGLRRELRKRAIDLMLAYQGSRRTEDGFLDMGVGYVLFARKERKLFHFLNDLQERSRFHKRAAREFVFKKLTRDMRESEHVQGLGEKRLRRILTTMWIFSHGLASLLNSNSLMPRHERFITQILRETGKWIILGEREERERARRRDKK
jgi:AcrR family transcriptional regulator